MAFKDQNFTTKPWDSKNLNYTFDKFSNIASRHLKIILIPHFQWQTYFHNRTRKLVKKIVARSKHLEHCVINSGLRYHEI